MKKFLAKLAVLSLLVVPALSLAADEPAAPNPQAETTSENIDVPADETNLHGTVLSFDAENGEFLILTETNGEVLVRFEQGVLPVDKLYPGLEVTVQTNGVMTMSLPGQVNALAVEVVCTEGTFTGFEDGRMLVENEDGVFAFVFGEEGVLVDGLELLREGALVQVFHSAASTRSLPPQSAATVVRVL